MRFGIFCLFLFFSIWIFAQANSSLNEKISKRIFSDYSYSPTARRSFVSLKNKSIIAKLNPFTYVSGSLLFVYQRCFSEQIQANCTYEISCSNYARVSMEKHGAFLGLLMGLDQLSCCFTGVADERERCSIGKNGKVINEINQD